MLQSLARIAASLHQNVLYFLIILCVWERGGPWVGVCVMEVHNYVWVRGSQNYEMTVTSHQKALSIDNEPQTMHM